jgi:phosphoribosylformimino-5-aminoimidazole carboxamide ribotide isomerase
LFLCIIASDGEQSYNRRGDTRDIWEAIRVSDRALYPVIGLLGGRALRALPGGATTEALEGDPIALALALRDQGARWLQLVDLDGAREGEPQQLELIKEIIGATGLQAQVAGGMSAPEHVATALEAGAARVILNGATPDDQALVAVCAALWGERIAVALDTRDGQVTVAGWLPSDAANALDVARAMRYLRVSTLIVTSVSSQASQANDPLLPLLRRALPSIRLIAGGAITSLEQLESLLSIGLDGALLGRGLSDGFFTLSEALAIARDAPAATIVPLDPEDLDELSPASNGENEGETSGSGWVDSALYAKASTGADAEEAAGMTTTVQMRALLADEAADVAPATSDQELGSGGLNSAADSALHDETEVE